MTLDRETRLRFDGTVSLAGVRMAWARAYRDYGGTPPAWVARLRDDRAAYHARTDASAPAEMEWEGE